MYKFINRIPLKTIVYLIAVWVLLAITNIGLKKAGFYQDVPTFFPISVFSGPTFHSSGIPYLLLFIVLVAFSIKIAPKLSLWKVWCTGFALIILGNLGQGDWDSAFSKPFYQTGKYYYHDDVGREYYQDAIKITSWTEWLESFNANQQTLFKHARTHPPFAVLIHYLFLYISANSIIFLGMAFVLISSLSIVLIYRIFQILNVPIENTNLLALLFSIIPAVNIYSAVSLDGIILTSSTIFLLGVVILLKSGTKSTLGLLFIALGIIITNLLTYVGVFLIGVASILAFGEFIIYRRKNIGIYLLISLALLFATIMFLFSIYGYNHIQGFITASTIENPHGFRGWYEPFTYLATRVECVSEISLFLSFGILAVLFKPKKLGLSYFDWRNININIFFSGILTLLGMFVVGAYRTGETARTALFIYPYIFLTLKNTDAIILKDILILAGTQTVIMQLFGSYFW